MGRHSQGDPRAVAGLHAGLQRGGYVGVAATGRVPAHDKMFAQQEAGQLALGNIQMRALAGAAPFHDRGHHHASREHRNNLVRIVQRDAGNHRRRAVR